MRTARTLAPGQKTSCFRVIENMGGGFLFRQTSDIDGHDHFLFVLDVAFADVLRLMAELRPLPITSTA